MTVIAMSRTEIDRMHVLRDLAAGRMTAHEAAQLMRLTRRHVFRLAKAYRERGPSALVSTRRGKPSNRRYPAALRTEVLGLIKANYADFGPTLACEKLAERHGLHLGVETVRQWMLADGLWRDRRQRLKPVHQPRYRRDCVGELVQIDGSEHGWFEDRGPPCTLLVFVDDATSRLMPSLDDRNSSARRGPGGSRLEDACFASEGFSSAGLGIMHLFCTCAWCRPSRPLTTSKPRGPTCSATVSRWRSTPTSTACSGSTVRTRRAETA